ncbi:MAG: hypothetical protein LQ350_000114 [Teloschistes chrysophthalmus]|nr:MAG: hypothetical protein LQ350_000114 [Niorma chrysophthalma]
MYGSVADWPRFYKDCYDHLAPGGYLEQAELNPVLTCDDGSIKPGDAIDECGKLAVRFGEVFGKSLMVEEFMQDDIRRAGFTNVVKKTYKWPIGAWSNDPKLKELGRFNLRHWHEGLEGWTLRFYTKYLGVSDIFQPIASACWKPTLLIERLANCPSGVMKKSRSGMPICGMF